MNISQNYFSPELINAIGWTLFHSIWIGGAIYAVLIILFSFLNNISSQQRYYISFYSLLLLFMMSFFCFLSIYNENPSSALTTYTGESILNINSQKELVEISSDRGISLVLKNIKLFLTQNLPVTVFIWTVGVILMLTFYSGVFIYTFRLKFRNLTDVEPALDKLIFHLSRKINLDQKVKIFESTMAKIPMAVGYFKPVILFPMGFLTGLSPDQIEVIILHELVHISRADFPSKILQSIVEIALFINPFTWLISSKINEERENSCDDIVLGNCTDAMIYAKALLKAGSYNFSHLQWAQSLTGNKNLLLRRIKRMFNKSNEAKSYRNLTSFSFIVLFSMIFYITSQSDQVKKHGINETEIPVIHGANFGGLDLIDPMPLINDFPIHDTSSETGEKIFTFNAEFEGENSEWKVMFKKGKISEIYRDGKKIPEDEVKKYEGLVYEEIAEIKSGNFPFMFDKYAFHKDEKNEDIWHLKKRLKEHKFMMPEFNEKLQIEMKKLQGKLDSLHLEEFHFKFDSSAFNKQMKELQEHLHDFQFDGKFKFDNFHFDFDSSGFNEKMEDLKRHLEEMEFENKFNMKEFQFKFDEEKEKILQESLQSILDKELINGQVEASLNQLENEIGNLNINLEALKPELESLNKELEILEHYIQEIKSELIKDGLIESKEEKVNLNFDSGELYLNGEKIPDDLQPKYKAIHDKYFD